MHLEAVYRGPKERGRTIQMEAAEPCGSARRRWYREVWRNRGARFGAECCALLGNGMGQGDGI
jgi:hypothetical protein